MPDPFATPAELATFLRTATQAEADAGSTDVLDTGVATQALALASGAIRAECKWNILQETVTAVIPPGDMQRQSQAGWSGTSWAVWSVFLPTLRLTALSVSLDGVALAQGVDFTWRSNGTVTLSSARYWIPTSQFYAPVVQFTYTHGYAVAPDEVKAVALERAAQAYENPTRKSQSTVGGVSDVYFRTDPVSTGKEPSDARLGPYMLLALA